jgi:UDP-galactopyranose mutase
VVLSIKGTCYGAKVITVDYLIVGSGMTGSTIARVLADHGREVLIVERRRHLGGNVYDALHESQIRYHVYGPHYFRCSSRRIWDFVNRFSPFHPYQATVKAMVNGRLESWPLPRQLLDCYPGWEQQQPAGSPRNFEEACLQKMPRALYEDFVQGYTSRQWGIEPHLLEHGLAARVRINDYQGNALMPQRVYQGLPTIGYANLMTNMIAGIPYILGTDYIQNRYDFRARKALVFTGPIDEFFGYDEGRLAYRSQRREHQFLANVKQYQPCVQVNYPNARDTAPIRTIEWKHLTSSGQSPRKPGTLITKEYPFSPEDPNQFEYPVPMARYRKLHNNYAERAKRLPKVVICGRLGEYRYLDMNHAIGRSMAIAQRLCAA